MQGLINPLNNSVAMKETLWGKGVFSCETDKARAKIFMQKDVDNFQPYRNWETIVFSRLRYGIVYPGWTACQIVSLKMEPSREDKSKSKCISAQFSWKPCIERQVSSTSHRERIAFLGVGRARKTLADELVPMHLSQEPTEWRQAGSWGWQGQVLPSLPSWRGQHGSSETKPTVWWPPGRSM